MFKNKIVEDILIMVVENWELSLSINNEKTFALYSDDNVLLTHEKERMLVLRDVLIRAQKFIDNIPDEPIN